ncbi:MAG: hypothetical protein FWC80_07555 [Firmicutes bacterium]|nr:hypothetical protein [Bacillota bacterium]
MDFEKSHYREQSDYAVFTVIARSVSDEAIPCKVFYSWDCFVAFASRNDGNPVGVGSLSFL